LCEKESLKEPNRQVNNNLSLETVNNKLNQFLNEETKLITNIFHFGKTDKAFNFKFVQHLIKKNDILAIIDYFRIYFVKLDVKKAVAMWDPTENKVLIIEDDCFKRTYCPKDFKIVYVEGKTTVTWKVVDWFYSSNNAPFKQTQKISGDRLFVDKTGTQYLNLFPELLHAKKERKPLSSYSKQTQEGVKKIWEHILTAWASNKNDQYDYLRKWFAHFISGKRMTSALYLRAVEGIGKSIVIDFLRNYVLGPSVVYQTSDSEILSSQFNAPLLGIMLFVLKEAPCSTLGEWKKLDSKLKNYITEAIISIRLMRVDAFKTNNTVSFIINTNSYAIAMNHQTRRYFSSDCSSVYKGNRKYFIELGKIMSNEEVGEAFYFNCLDIAKEFPDFHEQFEIPITDEYVKNVNDNISTIYLFIKERYVLKAKGIDCQYKHFYDDYVRFCNAFHQKKNILKKGAVKDKLVEIGINIMVASTKHNNKTWIKNTYNELLEIFKKNHLMNDIDDFHSESGESVEKEKIIKPGDFVDESEKSSEVGKSTLELKPNKEFLIDPVDGSEIINIEFEFRSSNEETSEVINIDDIEFRSTQEESIDESHVDKTISEMTSLL